MVTAGVGETRTGSFLFHVQKFSASCVQNRRLVYVYMYTMTEKFSVPCPHEARLPREVLIVMSRTTTVDK